MDQTTAHFISAMMGAMVVLAAPACLFCTGIAVLIYRRWRADDEE